jgi:hypothetical protein
MPRAGAVLGTVVGLAVLVPWVSGATLSGTCRANLTALPTGVLRCSSAEVSEIWTPGRCADRSGNLAEDGRILLSDDFASALSGDAATARSKCTELCKHEAAPLLGWHQCAQEGHACACRGTVRFGSSASWVERYVNGAIDCTGEEFGDLAGEPKTCQCRHTFTGCELVASTEENKGCYVHTSTSVFTGSGSGNAQCWSDVFVLDVCVFGLGVAAVVLCERTPHAPCSYTHTHLFALRTRSKWHDSQGDGCDWYAAAPHRCRVYGDSYSSYGMTGAKKCRASSREDLSFF